MNIKKKIETFFFPDILRALKVTLRYALGRGAMRKLSAFKNPVLKRPRVVTEKCVGCKLCAGICPAKAIEIHTVLTDGMRPDVSFKVLEEKCAACGLCVEACPESALAFEGRENVRR